MEQIHLTEYNQDKDLDNTLRLISLFWKEHNNADTSREDDLKDLADWTVPGHQLWMVEFAGEMIGFAHMGSRGGEIDWLEDLFIMPKYQGRGFGSQVIQLLEDQVRQYSESLYIEVAARNLHALKLYHRLGYDCLNTLTVRKDFKPENFDCVSKEIVSGHELVIRKYND